MLKFGVEHVYELVGMLYPSVKLCRLIKGVQELDEVTAKFVDHLNVRLLSDGQLE